MTDKYINQNTVLTTYQCAALLQCNPTSVNNWLEQGHMQGFKTPGGHRRVRAGDLVAFMMQRGMQIPDELRGAT